MGSHMHFVNQRLFLMSQSCQHIHLLRSSSLLQFQKGAEVPASVLYSLVACAVVPKEPYAVGGHNI